MGEWSAPAVAFSSQSPRRAVERFTYPILSRGGSQGLTMGDTVVTLSDDDSEVTPETVATVDQLAQAAHEAGSAERASSDANSASEDAELSADIAADSAQESSEAASEAILAAEVSTANAVSVNDSIARLEAQLQSVVERLDSIANAIPAPETAQPSEEPPESRHWLEKKLW